MKQRDLFEMDFDIGQHVAELTQLVDNLEVLNGIVVGLQKMRVNTAMTGGLEPDARDLNSIISVIEVVIDSHSSHVDELVEVVSNGTE